MSFIAVDPAFTAGVEQEKSNFRNLKHMVLVTGGTSGIGYSICSHLASFGHKVIAASRSAETGKIIAENWIELTLDITKPESIQQALSWLNQNQIQISVLINNAGTGLNAPLEEIEVENLQSLFDLNFFGLHRLTKSVLPQLRALKFSYIINISSIAGQIGLPYRGAYSASKFAVEGYTEALRMELLPFGVNVVLVQPGEFKTNITQNRKTANITENSPHWPYFNTVNTKVNAGVNNADDPEIVAVTIRKIIENPNPKFRYKVAKPLQKLSVTLSRILPFTWFQNILLKFYGL
ncbi:MAG: SDR family oxidoreductase [Luteibaculaceae bacterium]